MYVFAGADDDVDTSHNEPPANLRVAVRLLDVRPPVSCPGCRTDLIVALELLRPQYEDRRAHLAHIEQTVFVDRPSDGWALWAKGDSSHIRAVYTLDGRKIAVRCDTVSRLAERPRARGLTEPQPSRCGVADHSNTGARQESSDGKRNDVGFFTDSKQQLAYVGPSHAAPFFCQGPY